MKIKVGIVILNYNTAEDTINCIDSIKKTTNSSYCIYVVDGCSTDTSFEVLSPLNNSKEIKVVKVPINGGFSYGNNIGIKLAIKDGCDYVLISNPDVVYYKNSIDSMIYKLQNNPEIGAIGPSTRSLDQEESQLFRKVYTKKMYFFSRKPWRFLGKIVPELQTEYSRPKKINNGLFIFEGMIRGCSFAMPAKLLEQIGLLDDNVFLYCEEWILAKKLKDLNLMAACDFDARILHKEATSTQQQGSAFQTYHLYLSSFYYLKKYLKCNRFELFLFFVQNVTNYALHAVVSDDYKSKLKQFIKTNKQLLKGEITKIPK